MKGFKSGARKVRCVRTAKAGEKRSSPSASARPASVASSARLQPVEKPPSHIAAAREPVHSLRAASRQPSEQPYLRAWFRSREGALCAPAIRQPKGSSLGRQKTTVNRLTRECRECRPRSACLRAGVSPLGSWLQVQAHDRPWPSVGAIRSRRACRQHRQQKSFAREAVRAARVHSV